MSTKSPTPNWPSTSMNTPEIRSFTTFCRPNATVTAMIDVPAMIEVMLKPISEKIISSVTSVMITDVRAAGERAQRPDPRVPAPGAAVAVGLAQHLERLDPQPPAVAGRALHGSVDQPVDDRPRDEREDDQEQRSAAGRTRRRRSRVRGNQSGMASP